MAIFFRYTICPNVSEQALVFGIEMVLQKSQQKKSPFSAKKIAENLQKVFFHGGRKLQQLPLPRASHIRALQARLRTERRERKRLACSRGYRRSARSASASARRSEERSERRRSMADRLGEGACKAHEARERPGPFM